MRSPLLANDRCSGDLMSSTSSVIATAKMPSASASTRDLARPRASITGRCDSTLIGVPPRLRLTPLRCPPRGSNSRLGAALRRECVPPRLRHSCGTAERRGGGPEHRGEIVRRHEGAVDLERKYAQRSTAATMRKEAATFHTQRGGQ